MIKPANQYFIITLLNISSAPNSKIVSFSLTILQTNSHGFDGKINANANHAVWHPKSILAATNKSLMNACASDIIRSYVPVSDGLTYAGLMGVYIKQGLTWSSSMHLPFWKEDGIFYLPNNQFYVSKMENAYIKWKGLKKKNPVCPT